MLGNESVNSLQLRLVASSLPKKEKWSSYQKKKNFNSTVEAKNQLLAWELLKKEVGLRTGARFPTVFWCSLLSAILIVALYVSKAVSEQVTTVKYSFYRGFSCSSLVSALPMWLDFPHDWDDKKNVWICKIHDRDWSDSNAFWRQKIYYDMVNLFINKMNW